MDLEERSRIVHEKLESVFGKKTADKSVFKQQHVWLEQDVGRLKEDIRKLNREQERLKLEVSGQEHQQDLLEMEVEMLRETVMQMKSDYGRRLGILFDGCCVNYDLNKDNRVSIVNLESDMGKQAFKMRYQNARS